ncbi:leukocyte elastase inhibitor-like [Maylandia zebra]|uniref:leukocyte elastase inhibitor-like n=1 Tax=Maylandia zebra TaxID=106582 RepID=UPI00403CCA3E
MSDTGSSGMQRRRRKVLDTSVAYVRGEENLVEKTRHLLGEAAPVGTAPTTKSLSESLSPSVSSGTLSTSTSVSSQISSTTFESLSLISPIGRDPSVTSFSSATLTPSSTCPSLSDSRCGSMGQKTPENSSRASSPSCSDCENFPMVPTLETSYLARAAKNEFLNLVPDIEEMRPGPNEFLKGTKKHYNAELESVDFKGNAEEARVHINSWVEKQTQDKIKDLLSQDAVGSLTKLVLVNAIYFKGSWNTQFKEEKTADVHFRLNKNDTKPVKMMQQKSKFPFATIPEANCKILEMPYKGNDLSMLIFLPNDIEDDTTGLEKLEKELTYQNFVDWTRPDMMSPNEVDVKLPRFKMEEKYDLEKILTNMGMENAFDIYKRDFSGMSPANDLIVSKVVHKALVDVNEGAEAAAATGVDMEVRSITIPAEFVADHPFIFFIRHKPTKSILFVGRYCSPE